MRDESPRLGALEYQRIFLGDESNGSFFSEPKFYGALQKFVAGKAEMFSARKEHRYKQTYLAVQGNKMASVMSTGAVYVVGSADANEAQSVLSNFPDYSTNKLPQKALWLYALNTNRVRAKLDADYPKISGCSNWKGNSTLVLYHNATHSLKSYASFSNYSRLLISRSIEVNNPTELQQCNLELTLATPPIHS